MGCVAVTLLLSLSACAGFAPVPGGTESVNEACFSSEEELKSHIASLTPGMAQKDVLAGLCRKKEEMTQIDRRDIRIALLGGDNIPFTGKPDLIEELYGYRMVYRSIRRKHGFTSPIRIRTDEAGFNYTITVIFHDGKLFAPPALAGGPVRNWSTGTLFDFITPGVIIDRVTP